MLKRAYVRVAAVASSVFVVSLSFLPKNLLQSRILGLIKVQRLSRVRLVLFGSLTSRILSALTFAEKRRRGKRRGGHAGQPETSLLGHTYEALLISKPYLLCVFESAVCVCVFVVGKILKTIISAIVYHMCCRQICRFLSCLMIISCRWFRTHHRNHLRFLSCLMIKNSSPKPSFLCYHKDRILFNYSKTNQK